MGNLLIILSLFSLILGEIARINIGSNIAVTLTDLFVLITVVFFAASQLLKRTKPKLPYFKVALFFILACLLSLAVSAHLYTQQQVFVSFSYLLRWILYFSIFYVSVNLKNSKTIEKAMIIVGFVLVIVGYLQFFFYSNLRNLFYLGWDDHLYRMFSSFLDPNFFGIFLVLYLLFLLHFTFQAFKEKQVILRLVYSILVSATVVAIFLTFSRTAIVIFIIGSIIFLLLKQRKKMIFGVLAIAFL